ncbi:hypothetical protein NM3164_0146 [Neisseria meningitidis NM3164]|uniref:Uncharacterized protein n=3 Tax=Neisseria meningitidis TaxID=487 RepID=A0A0Y5VMC0_NEIME|nr:hypothetical protein NMBM01240355_0135 [Neisseria meningitidis M01-240355]ADZ00679.1 hypothetical protein NMBM04240196_0140 [Neisseria meningitidis M04-240196]AJC63395.1 hypothetical protein N875_07220 [Neisseria meningitidis LNP21362]ANW88654.1 hypothetical protein DE10444_0129 [Neisseria meningitidis]EGC57765.1 hypothetical protein NMBM13399_0117 [Neisseria meningitidis M13399]EGC63648.1 hypothetical protein NMBCU385_0089 [Neisseria meningitidis CU385]EGC67608.1 hypothetical protein NMBM
MENIKTLLFLTAETNIPGKVILVSGRTDDTRHLVGLRPENT